MTTAEAVAQIREALKQTPFQVRDRWLDAQALTALDSLEAENAQLRTVVEAARHAEDQLRMYGSGVPLIKARHELRDALVALDSERGETQ